MGKPHQQSRSWRIFRIYFRRFRISVWLCLLVILGSLLYLNQIGLPDFIKNPLIEKLHARGIDLQFSRMRLHFTRGIVADNVLIVGAKEGDPKLTVKEVQVLPDFGKLAHLRFQINSVLLRQGRLVCPVSSANQPGRQLVVSNIQTELRFLPDDVWELDHLRAQFADADLQLNGIITNASALRDWKFASPHPSAKPLSLQERLRELSDVLEKIHFSSTPELKLQVSGDARDMFSFAGQLTVRAPGAQTPWGAFNDGQLSVRVIPPDSPGQRPKGEMNLRAASAQTDWGGANNLDLTFHAVATEGASFNADLDLAAARVTSKWGTADDARFNARWLHSPTNPIPTDGHAELRVAKAETLWGSGRELQLSGWLSTPTNLTAKIDPSWDQWTNIAPFIVNLDCRLGFLQASNLIATNILCAAHWQAPDLQISKLSAQLYRGSITAYANLAVNSREFSFSDVSDFNVKEIAPLLTPMAQHWLSQYSWEKPPSLNAAGALILPAWTNRHPDWRAEVKPTIKLRGYIAAGNGAFRGVAFDSATLHFNYTNLFWQLPDIVAIRPEGRLEMLHEANDATQDYYFRFHSTIDARAIRPLLEPQQYRGFDLVGFTAPPIVNAEVWGRWRDQDRIGVKASLVMSNFTFRGESADWVQSTVIFTNRLLSFIEPQLQRNTGQMSAAGVTVDLDRERVFITNGVSTADPMSFARAIGPVTARAIEPYHFLKPPRVNVNGSVPFRQNSNADLHFTVDGGPFEWWNFKVAQIVGKVDWVGDKLFLREVHGAFYGGTADGDAEFDFSKGETANCRFDVVVADSDLHSLMTDLDPHTNRLEGTLNCRLTVAEGDAANVNSWKGAGRVSLHNGFIWELPVFGVLSPVLEGITPGLGNSRATDGTATYILENGVLRSDDMEIRASGMRLKYRGDVALNGNVDSRVEAELLRDTWVVGRMLSLALWPVSKVLEYKITGTLMKPKMEPLYLVPRMILIPLHPFETMKDLLSKPPEPASTNAAPEHLP